MGGRQPFGWRAAEATIVLSYATDHALSDGASSRDSLRECSKCMRVGSHSGPSLVGAATTEAVAVARAAAAAQASQDQVGGRCGYITARSGSLRAPQHQPAGRQQVERQQSGQQAAPSAFAGVDRVSLH